MKFIQSLLLISAFVAISRSHGQDHVQTLPEPEIISEEANPPARSVRINLNTVEGAVGYEVHVFPVKKMWVEPWKFTVTNEESFVRLRLSPGKYAVKTRSLAKDQTAGQWSKLHYFDIEFGAIQQRYPGAKEEIEPKGRGTEILAFEWPKAENAKWYYFHLKDKQGQLLRSVLTKQTYLKSELNVQSEYRWSVTPLKDSSEYKKILESGISENDYEFKILSPAENTRGYFVKIDAAKDAVKYQFEVVKINSEGTIGAPSFFDAEEPEIKFRLTAGQYETRVRSIYAGGKTSEWTAPIRFFIQFNPPKLLSPTHQASLESTDDAESKVVLKWQPEDRSASYMVYVFNEDNKVVLEKRTEATELEVRLAHNATYRWVVKAYSRREPSTTSAERPDKTAREFTINEYVKLDLSPAEESSQAYGWLRHFSSMAKYQGNNTDNNAIVKQTLFAGEGEIAAGYWSRKNKLGILAQASLAGFLLKGTNYTNANLGISGGYRKALDNGARLRVWLGLNYQELPEILTHPFTQQVVVKKSTTLGPQIMISYLQHINQKYGWQVYTSSYLSAKDMGSPNGLAQNPTWSYKVGIQGIYSSSAENKWMMGYSYKVDQLSYATTDVTQIPNTASLIGHYLNLTYEFSFESPLK